MDSSSLDAMYDWLFEEADLETQKEMIDYIQMDIERFPNNKGLVKLKNDLVDLVKKREIND